MCRTTGNPDIPKIKTLVGNAGIGDVQAVDILESGKMSGAQIRHIVIPVLLHDQSLQRFDVTECGTERRFRIQLPFRYTGALEKRDPLSPLKRPDSFHVMIGEAGIHRHIQMFQLWKYIFCGK